MLNIHVDYPDADLNFQRASRLATDAACESLMLEPTIMSWHRHSNQGMSPTFEGANPESWWLKYGAGNGGQLDVSVGGEYEFVLMDAHGFESHGQMPLRNLNEGAGNEYICFTPLLGDSSSPSQKACSPLDDWLADQY